MNHPGGPAQAAMTEARAQDRAAPGADLRLVFWELTARCNLACRHCRASAQEHAVQGELDTEEILGVARDIREAGDPILVLTGGEALMREDFFNIARHCTQHFTRVALATNGTLVDDVMAARIAASGIQRVSISLDGATAATHDAFRGFAGSYEAALRGFDALRQAGLSVQVNVTVARHNVAELASILELAVSRGADAFHVFVLVPVGCGAEIGEEARLAPGEMEDVLRWLFDRSLELRGRVHVKATCAPQYYRIVREVSRARGLPVGGPGRGMEAMTRGCLAGTAVCFVSRTGDVQPCGYLPVVAGNVRERRFPEIWRDSDVFGALRNPAALKGKCHACGYRTICAGCRARAFAKTADFLAADPDCAYVTGGAATNAATQPDLLLALQRGIPLVPRPFAAVAERLGTNETAVLECVTALLERGTARRFGAVFDSRSLGYDSTLCAVDVPPADIEEVSARLTPHPGVTHCYEREGRPNLWFTLTAPKDYFPAERTLLAATLRPYELLDLPAWRTFKIEAVFDTRRVGGGVAPQPEQYHARRQFVPETLSGEERAIVRRLQDSIPVTAEPFTALGEALGWAPEKLLALLTHWQQAGILRRIGLIVRHRELGFVANAMCVWVVDPLRTADAGAILAGFPEVTHCYERRPHPRFPYNLFAMIHVGSRDTVPHVRDRMAAAAGLTGGLLLMSAREFKKSSPRFFEEA